MDNRGKSDWLVSSSGVPVEGQTKIETSRFVADVYRVYGQNFWDFYKLTVPPSVLALLVYTMRPALLNMITSGAPRGREILMHPGVIVGIWLANFGSFFLAWFFEAFSFGAVTDVVGALHTGTGIPEGDGYVTARERIWKIFKISLATYIPFVTGFFLLMLLFMSVVLRFNSPLLGNFWFGMVLATVEMFMVAAALIGFVFAVPLVMATDASTGKALRQSWRLTDGHEGKLILFVAESFLGALIVMYAMNWIGYLVFSRVSLGGWETWVLAITTALVGATAQAPMLIAFALLYFQVTDSQQA